MWINIGSILRKIKNGEKNKERIIIEFFINNGNKIKIKNIKELTNLIHYTNIIKN